MGGAISLEMQFYRNAFLIGPAWRFGGHGGSSKRSYEASRAPKSRSESMQHGPKDKQSSQSTSRIESRHDDLMGDLESRQGDQDRHVKDRHDRHEILNPQNLGV